MRWVAFGGLLVVAAAAAALVLLPGGPQPGAVDPGGDGPRPLAASLTAQPHACSLCHYAWDVPIRFEGTVEKLDAGWRYRMTFAPVAAYNLTDVRLAPVARGDETLSDFRIPGSGTLARGAEGAFSVHLPRESSALHFSLVGAREFGRSDLVLSVERADLVVGAASARAALLAPQGGLPAGEYVARIRYADGGPLQEAYTILADYAPPGLRVAPLGTQEAPAAFDFVLPERPRGFAVQLRPHNEHPSDKWLLPNWGDRGEVALFVSEGEPAAPRAWTDAEIEAAWKGERERVLDESRVDGVIARARDARGEWTRQARYLAPPGHEEPFPPLPPGTREVVAEVTWSPRTPLSPAPAPFLSWAHGLGPVFYYPEPEKEEPGRRVYRIPVDPAWWQEEGAVGGFQAFALLPLDAQGTTVFDGSYGLKLTARR